MSIKSELNIICKNCDGNGKNTFITASGHYTETCVYCCGTGKEDKVKQKMITRGQELRRRRVEAGQTLGNTAHALGFTPVGLSNIETGRATDGIERYEAYLNEIEEAKA